MHAGNSTDNNAAPDRDMAGHDGIDTGKRPQTATMKMVMVMAMVMEDKMEKMT
jgi:hypothetical protein